MTDLKEAMVSTLLAVATTTLVVVGAFALFEVDAASPPATPGPETVVNVTVGGFWLFVGLCLMAIAINHGLHAIADAIGARSDD